MFQKRSKRKPAADHDTTAENSLKIRRCVLTTGTSYHQAPWRAQNPWNKRVDVYITGILEKAYDVVNRKSDLCWTALLEGGVLQLWRGHEADELEGLEVVEVAREESSQLELLPFQPDAE